LPKDAGDCGGDFTPRYFFDSSDGTCKMFYFSGCNGNKNNFKTLEVSDRWASLQMVRPERESLSEETAHDQAIFVQGQHRQHNMYELLCQKGISFCLLQN